MGAVRACTGHELRRNWPAHVALAVVVMVVGGTVLAVAAGARRTSTAFDRFVDYSNPAEAFVVIGPSDQAHLDQVADLPEVERLSVLYQVALAVDTGDIFLPFAANVDGTLGTELGRPLVLEGRLPNPDAVDEVALSEHQADLLEATVGERLTLASFTPDQVDAMRTDEDPGEPAGPTVTLDVVGLVRDQGDVGRSDDDPGVVVLTPGFDRAYHDEIGSFVGYLAAADLRPGTDPEAFGSAVQEIYGDSTQTQVQPTGTLQAPLRSSLRVLSTGLALFALVVAVAGLVALALAVGRQVGTGVENDAVRRELGMTRAARATALMVPTLVVVGVGVLLAVPVAVALSPRFPIGLARQIEPDPGIAVDAAILVAGALALVLVVTGIATLTAARLVARAGRPGDVGLGSTRPRSLASLAASARLGPTAVTGIRLATEPGRGRTAVPVRPAMFGAFLAVTGIVAALVFGASLDALVDNPEAWGWGWDVSAPDTEAVRAVLAERDADIDDSVDALYLSVLVGSAAVSGIGLDSTSAMASIVVEGRAPQAPDEVVLGADTLARDDLVIGGTATAEGPDGPVELRIVGRGAFPSVADRVPLADGAALTLQGIQRLDNPDDFDGLASVVVRWADGVDVEEANQDLADAAAQDDEPAPTPRLPAEVERLTQVDRLPGLLAAFMVLLAVLAVGHATLASTTRRRADLGVLAVMGFVRRQIQATLGWQSATLALIGLVLGIPAGIIVGRLTWAATAESLGIGVDIVVPVAALAVTAIVALLLLAVIGLAAGGRATRRHPAHALRAE